MAITVKTDLFLLVWRRERGEGRAGGSGSGESGLKYADSIKSCVEAERSCEGRA